ncbi:oxysterol-binding protein 1 [Coccidioides immitis RMSCC 2394]|uniref:Oxysterol-binding protein 1 n=1 Tax=Coccidioides immitis RMSCC 2394 TaxID=404692 RepID=A0A0J7AXD6_COCIT|nr:oxysterol-binding protein 1 [Coccidioides immitis RMSCC 2394]
MAGMEEIEIHSKSYLVRWINVSGEHTISWSIQPHKKSLNFGIFKHPGTTGTLTATSASIHSSSDFGDGRENGRPGNASSSVVTEKLKGIGLKPIRWVGKCEADKISQGTYDVGSGEGGNYALVFDNTFSKQISKTATFVLLTYPTHCPPRSGHQIHHSQAGLGYAAVTSALTRSNPNIASGASDSTESLRNSRGLANSQSKTGSRGSDSPFPFHAQLHTGILQKRRRKRHQGFARRFFSLDFNTSTLSYYHDRNSSALRGAIPLTLAAIATNSDTREISIDSGAEIWHLRALNEQDFNVWKRALEKASKISEDVVQPEPKGKVRTHSIPTRRQSMITQDTKSWTEVGWLAEKVAMARDTVRQLAKDTDPKYLPYSSDRPHVNTRQMPQQTDGTNEMADREKRSFWKLKYRNDNQSAQRAVSHGEPFGSYKPPMEMPNRGRDPVHDRLMALLQELDSVVSDFSSLLEKKRPRPSRPPSIRTRPSIESDVSEEFFDANDGHCSPLLTMHRDSEDEDEKSVAAETAVGDESSLSGSDIEERDDFLKFRHDNSSSLFPTKPKSLIPLPVENVVRRKTVLAPTVMPPSLIGFLRKNVGKDLSTISMPVSANEPISLLQRAAEQFEYSRLLDKAASATDALERLIYVTAFAISPFSNMRVKERSIRKPFNPMLGETYELVRGDLGFRFIAEKVSHRPVQLAYQADSKDWSYAQSPKPTQKFWGKSAEIITEGKVRLTLHSSGEHFSWSPGTSFLRNIIAGEKYVEPVGEMCIVNETTGQKTVVTFKAGGMFSGRSEEVTVKAFDTHGDELPLGLQGSWTTSLQLTEHGRETNHTIWAAGSLVDKAPKHYGFTVFAASLNEITAVEKAKLPPTDSRLRPDQRALENGDVDQAENLKALLEEKQRHRRKEMEAVGEVWRSRWFTKVGGTVDGANGTGTGDDDDDGVMWKLNTGKDGYWEERARGQWPGTVPVFKL